jgi:hypothetical protein
MKRKNITELLSILNKMNTQGLDGEQIWQLLTVKRKVTQKYQDGNDIIKDLQKELSIETQQVDATHVSFHCENKDNIQKFKDALEKFNNEDCGEFNKFLPWDKFINWTNANNLSLDEVDVLSNAIAIGKEDSPLLKEKIKN